jgi:arsenite methyltransferase
MYMALLEDLPDYVHNSVEAYVRCVGGAMRKDAYLSAIKQAGFDDISIVGESQFPAELIAEQSALKKFIDKMKIPMSEMQRLGKTAVSLKLSAKKAALHETFI